MNAILPPCFPAAPALSPSQPAAPSGEAGPRIKCHRELFWVGVGYHLFIVNACLYCLYESAIDDHAALFVVVIRAALAVSEMGAAPVCYLARVHSSAAWRYGLAASALLFAFITAWNLFLPLDQGMRELIAAPQETAAALQEAEAAPERLRADEAQKRKDHEAAGQRVKDASAASGALPAQHCFKRRCQSDPRVAGMNNELDAATKAEAAAKTALDKAEQKRREAEGPKGVAALRTAQDNHRHAVNKNMVFGAVATLLGIDPVKISATEMSWALRLMTITVCVAAGLLGSLICLASVERIAPAKPAPPVKVRSVEQIELLKAGASEMLREASAAVVNDVAQEFKAAARKPEKTAPANDDAPKTPMGDALREFLGKAKRPRGRPRKMKVNGATPAKAAKPRKPQAPPDGGNPPLAN